MDSLQLSNRIVIEWPPFKTPPRIHDTLDAGELGTAIITAFETTFRGMGPAKHFVQLSICPDYREFMAPISAKKPAKKKQKKGGAA